MTFLNLSHWGEIVRALAGFALCCLLLSCSPTIRYHGYIPEAEELDALVVGVDTRGSVEDLIGPPNSSGVLADGGWYYISSAIRHMTYLAPETIERKIVAISFDENDVVTNVETFGLEDGRIVALSRRVTELPVNGPGFWRQILGNIGNLDPAGIIAGDN